jgi:hypothetical protein
MQKTIDRAFFATLIFTIGMLITLISPYFPETKILYQIILVISISYLFLGWYLFKGYYPSGHPLLLFIMGYFYAGVFIGPVFTLAKWPYASAIIAASLFWAIAQTILIFYLRKKIPQKGLVQFLVEITLMLLIAILKIIRFL